jgi:hypothetical protein
MHIHFPLVGIFNNSIGNCFDYCCDTFISVLYEIKEDIGRSILKHELSHSMSMTKLTYSEIY